MRPPLNLAALLIVALVFSAAECAASCAFVSCNPADAASSTPPCHHHSQPPSHQSPAPCGHELQLLGPSASLSQDSDAAPPAAVAPAPAFLESQPDLIAEDLHIPILSPPQLRSASLLVLRI